MNIDAAFLGSDGQTVVSPILVPTNFNTMETSCPSSFIVGVQQLSSPVTITDRTVSANISFLITNNGAWVESYERAGNPEVLWDVGPFSMISPLVSRFCIYLVQGKILIDIV